MMSKELERRLSEASEIAKKSRHEFVTLEHILLALTSSPVAAQILQACGVNVQTLKKQLKQDIQKTPLITDEQLDSYGGWESWNPEFTLACHRLFQRAALQVKSSGRNQISEGTLLVALFYEQESHAVYALSQQGLTQFDIINYISHGITKDDSAPGPFNEDIPAAAADPHQPKLDVDGQPVDDSKKNPLETFCQNLNEKVRAGKTDPLIGRDEILTRAIQVICRRTKNNPIFIGEPGVGKTALAEGLASRIVNNQVPEKLKDAVIYSLDLGTLLAGTKFRGDFEGRIKAVIKELQKRPHAILFIDEIHTIIGAGSTSGGSMDASNLLKPLLAQGTLPCIGSTTHAEYRQHFEKDRALSRRFQRIDVKEPSQAECFEILKGLQKRYEDFHQIQYTEDALRACVQLSSKHLHGKLLPDKAIDVMDEAGSFFSMQNKTDTITPAEIEQTVARMTGLPVQTVTTNEKMHLKDLDIKLKSLIFGQDEAIHKLTTAIKLSRSGLSVREKPIGNFLFTGPTGVGKTEVCKQLAFILGVHFHRFDMSEYSEKHSVARLTGAPPGYVGYEEGGLLTEAVNKHPYAVLLLDEIEKAHPDIFNSLLQVMDAGRMTDGHGRLADFKNVILVMTSNAGAQDVAKGQMGFVETESQKISDEALKKTFSPEFLNRLDAVVHFQNLNPQNILMILRKFIDELRIHLAEKKVDLVMTAPAEKWLAEKGYDKVYGARLMGRTVDQYVKTPLVDELLFGKLVDGGKVTIDLLSNKTSQKNNPANSITVESSATGSRLWFQFSTKRDPHQTGENQKETVHTGSH